MSQKPTVVVTMEQYRALQRPIDLPSSSDLFDFEVEGLVAKQLVTYAQADEWRKKLPDKGLFLFVPPCLTMSFNDLMALVEVDGKNGINHLDPQYLKDGVEVPRGPYIMVDIEDGDRRRNIKPSINRENILREGRSPYTTYEGIIHAILFPEVLKHHYLDLVGSRYESGYCPDLYLGGGRPKLFAFWGDGASPRWGAPSCGSRFGT